MTDLAADRTKTPLARGTPSPRMIYASLVLTTGLLVAAMCYVLFIGKRTIAGHGPLVDAAMEIRLEATNAHLWLEEILSGDRTEDINKVWQHLYRADWYAKVMLEGGESPEGIFMPLEDPEMRTQIEHVRKKLDEFREITRERYRGGGAQAAGTEIDRRYDAIFNDFVQMADQVETNLQKLIQNQLNEFESLQTGLIMLMLLLPVPVALTFHRYDRLTRQAQGALRQSEEDLSITLTSIGDAVIATDVEGNVTRMNPVAERLTGWVVPEAQGRPLEEVFNIISAETREKVESPVTRVLREGKIVGLANHTVLIARDGTERQIADSGAPIRDAEGKTRGVVMVFRDVTDSYLAQEALRQSEENLSITLASIGDAVIAATVEGNVTRMNPVAERLTGWAVSEAQGRPLEEVFNIISAETREKVESPVTRVLREGKIVGLANHTVLIARDGTERQIADSGAPIRATDGRIRGVVMVFRDVTDSYLAQEALRQSEHKFRELFHNTTDAIFLWRMKEDGSPSQCLEVNDVACQMLGYSRSALLGMTPAEIDAGSSSTAFREIVQELLVEGHTTFETFSRTKDGQLIPVEVGAHMFILNGQRVVRSAARDITDRKRLEKEVLEISTSEQRRIGQDLHDGLGQNLTGIAFMSKALERKLAAKGVKEAADAEQIAELVGEVLTETQSIARMLNPEELASGGLISALHNLASEIESVYDIVCTFEHDASLQVESDPVATHVFRIVQEATNNAIRHGKAKFIEIRLRVAGDSATLTVQDDGTGFALRARKTSGMGLRIMDYRARMIGGKLDITRGSAGGTLLTCSFRNEGREE